MNIEYVPFLIYIRFYSIVHLLANFITVINVNPWIVFELYPYYSRFWLLMMYCTSENNFILIATWWLIELITKISKNQQIKSKIIDNIELYCIDIVDTMLLSCLKFKNHTNTSLSGREAE